MNEINGEPSRQSSSNSLTPLERRREERKRKDPHFYHPFRRLFIGPSPVTTKSAASVAAAIAHDVEIEHPTSIGIVGSTGTIAATVFKRHSLDSIAIQSQATADDSNSLHAPTNNSIRGQSSFDNLDGNEQNKNKQQKPLKLSLNRTISPQPLQRTTSPQPIHRTFSSSPTKRYRDLSPTHHPRELSPIRTAAVRPSSRVNSFGGQQKRLIRDASFASAKSRTGSIDGTQDRRPSVQFDEDTSGLLRHRHSRRRLSQSLAETTRIPNEQESFKPNKVQHQDSKQRRQYSEGSTYHSPNNVGLDSYDIGYSSHRDSKVLPLLDTSVAEESFSDTGSSPQRQRAISPTHLSRSEDGMLKPMSSHRSMGSRFRNSERFLRSKTSDTSMDGGRLSIADAHHSKSPTAPSANQQKISDPPASSSADIRTTGTEEWAGEGLTSTHDTQYEHTSSSRMDELRGRARDRHRQSRLTSGRHSRIASSTQRQPSELGLGGGNKRRSHIREVSRQSKMSYLSTVGTLTSIGTRFTEGSFGAHGGFRAKLARSFKFNSNKSNQKSNPNIRAEARRHARRKSSGTGGVLPGSVGTSAGGTKWVGQTFEVGKRFWQAIENREEMLLVGDYALDDVPEEELDTEEIEEKKRKERQASDENSIIRSPDDVLKSFAREASDAVDNMNGGNRQRKGRKGTSTDASMIGKNGKAPALVFSGSDSEPSDGVPKTPDRIANGHGQYEDPEKLKPNETQSLPANNDNLEDPAKTHTLERVQSATSLLTVPQDRVAQSAWDIENRSGWSDVMTFISAQSSLPASIQRSARSAGDNLNEFGSKAKRALDGQFADFRAKQVAAKQAREKTRSEDVISRQTIREASEDENSSKSPSADAALVNQQQTKEERQRRKALARKFLSKIPEPPKAAEEKFPELTFELTRRSSMSMDGQQVEQNDAASDHEVAARPTFEKKNDEEKPNVDLSTLRPKTVRIDSEKHSPMELPSLPVEGESPSENAAPGELPSSILNQDHSEQRHLKVVKFTGSLNNLPKRSLTTNELIPSTSNADSMTANLAGRIRPMIRMGNAAPAPPEEVLMRDSTPDEQIIKKGGKSANESDLITSKSILRRDRMLAKLMWTPSECVPKEFTERESRKFELHSEPFREYMVVLRMGRLELWDDPRWMQRMMEKTENLNLRLRYVAPLRKGHAFVSLYSPVDTIFCLSFVPVHHRHLLNLRRSGTHLWLFDGRSSTNGADWMWDLWRELGGQIPDAIDVHVPVLGFRVRIPIPEEMPNLGQKKAKTKSITSKVGIRSLSSAFDENDGDEEEEEMSGEGYKWINRKNVIKAVSGLACCVPQWGELHASLKRRGIHFGLAWRTQSTLNWIQHSTTTDEQNRDWAVLVGSILCDSKSPSSLEFRAAMHYPQSVRSIQGGILQEPPAIEGFLWRVKAVSGALTRLYITTQDGLIFVNRPSRAFPPERYIAIEPTQNHQVKKSNSSLGEISVDAYNKRRSKKANRKAVQKTDDTLATLGKQAIERITTEAFSVEELDGQIEAFHAFEKRRLFEQIANSDGYVDVRDIFSIHCLDGKGGIRRVSADGRGTKANVETPPLAKEEAESPQEFEDVGGEEGYELSKDRAALKQSRQFEVTMMNGRSIRFEAYSQSVCHEWVEGLYNLALYWKRREKVDALENMTACGNDPAMVHRKMKPSSNSRPLENEAGSEKISPILTDIWNWCILDGCRTVLRSGRLFSKKMPYSAFASRYCILISGRILTFKLMTSNRTARARQNAGIFHKRQDTVIHLRDSYVYSGRLTDHMLVNGRSDGAGALSNFGGGTGGASTSSTRHTLPRIYADGLLSTDEDEDCTFVIRYRPQRVNKSLNPHLNVDQENDFGGQGEYEEGDQQQFDNDGKKANVSITTLRDSTVNVIAMRARSKLERDLWVWAINAERERIVRQDVLRENQIRQHGQTPFKTSHHFHSLH